MPMKSTARTPLLLCAFGLASCASTGGGKIDALTIDDAERIVVVGKTTKSDAKAAFGEAQVVPFACGEEVWIYDMKNGAILKAIPLVNRLAADGGNLKELKIVFGKDGFARKFRLQEVGQSQ